MTHWPETKAALSRLRNNWRAMPPVWRLQYVAHLVGALLIVGAPPSIFGWPGLVLSAGFLLRWWGAP